MLVDAYFLDKQYDKAAAQLDTILKAEPNRDQTALRLGSVYLASGNTKQAIQVFDVLIAKDSTKTAPRVYKAEALLKQGNTLVWAKPFAVAATNALVVEGRYRHELKPDGTLVTGWLALQVTIAAVLLAISRISMAAVSRWVERENLYREMSTIDGLTRLTNRRSFIERGESQLSRALRTPAASVACVMVDLDHFKRINDTWATSGSPSWKFASTSALRP